MIGHDVIHQGVHRLEGGPANYDGLLQLIAGSRVVLLGEASHGTQEFYRERAMITRASLSHALVAQHNYNAAAV